MNKEDKKRMVEAYNNMKHPMGVFVIRLKESMQLQENKCHIAIAKDLRSIINSTKIKLASNFYPIRELQMDWLKHGESAFEIVVLEELAYSEEGNDIDYEDDLQLLRLIWIEKLEEKGYRLYKKSING